MPQGRALLEHRQAGKMAASTGEVRLAMCNGRTYRGRDFALPVSRTGPAEREPCVDGAEALLFRVPDGRWREKAVVAATRLHS